MEKNRQMFRLFFLVSFLTLVSSSSMLAQSLKITGEVSDERGETMPGVSVVIKGTTTGTISGMDGTYHINATSGQTLVYSFVGMVKQEVLLSQQTTINITLEEESIDVDEVVIVGYGAQQKKTLTGSVGTIQAKELVQRPTGSVSELLQGQVAGLTVMQNSSLPGSDGATISIRGFSRPPLVIIDGVPGSMDALDPNDIESMSVLKDASAGIYGARGGEGVILITTKRG